MNGIWTCVVGLKDGTFRHVVMHNDKLLKHCDVPHVDKKDRCEEQESWVLVRAS